MKTPRLFGNGSSTETNDDETSMGKQGGELGPSTRMQLGWVVTLGVCLVGTTAAYFSTLYSIKNELNAINARLNAIYSDYWGRNQQAIFALRLRLMNSNLIVPDVDDVKNRAESDKGDIYGATK